MMRGSIVLLCATILGMGAFLPGMALSLDYPTKPVELVVPYTAGSSLDVVSRLIAEIAPTYMPQPIVVVNKPGAGGSLAAAEVIQAKPDGYKLNIQGNMFFATTVKTQKVPFNPDDLVPIANFMEWRLGLIVRQDSPWKTLGDLLAYAKKNPGELKWSHLGRGIPPTIILMSVFKKAGVQTIDVPYKGNPEAFAALLGRHVDACSMGMAVIKDQAKAGNVRYLVFYSDHRYSDEPNVPCLQELGFSEAAKLMTFGAIWVHKNTPEAIKSYLFNVCKKIYDDPRFKKLPDMGGEDPRWGGPDFVKQKVKDMEEAGIPVLKELGLYTGK
ncbi:MAG TPA: tripartite tricarboxylate transporter substrate binding protein [Syntrophorhabdales bacterium]|nr:tripartite tricarboxylate transporter substrate binding protein [Syntrophorhabdales bacterium]